jgi:hypothetical protein
VILGRGRDAGQAVFLRNEAAKNLISSRRPGQFIGDETSGDFLYSCTEIVHRRNGETNDTRGYPKRPRLSFVNPNVTFSWDLNPTMRPEVGDQDK